VTTLPPFEFSFASTAQLIRGALEVAFGLIQALALIYSAHRWLVLWRAWRDGRDARVPAPAHPASQEHVRRWPTVTVQLPVYNEPRVVRRLIAAAAALDYPRELLEIQVLDDSTDGTSSLAAREAELQRARGVDVRHMKRGVRDGHKAGALAGGLDRARGELVAVFDADFLPAPDFLRRLVPRFDDPGIGMAQARWTHLNRPETLLTAAQAVMLDAHFLLEHETRARRGLYFNFNGTAGLWRRSCIVDAGGWRNDTLTEDLDLSYRAQLRGWRLAYDSSVEVPGELPADIAALKSQQRRWARGSIQTARRVLPKLIRRPLPLALKLEAFVHLTGNAAYPLLLLLGLLMLPLMSSLGHPADVWMIQLAVVLLGALPVALFLIQGQRRAGRPARRIALEVPAAFALGIGLSFNNALAVIRGLGPRLGEWERTPKSGSRGERLAAPRERAGWRNAGAAELALAAYFVLTAAAAWSGPCRNVAPHAMLIGAGFGWAAWSSWRAARVRAAVAIATA
jgi:cellulose synthase/poly-beta-1,6-N-acetylglucosamine synthase-like glycosyltransferase